MTFSLSDLAQLDAFIATNFQRTLLFTQLAWDDWTPDDVAIRHDIDSRLGYSLRMARWEHERGYTSTYFVLPTADYYQSPNTAHVLRQIQELGHEIGLHSDTLNTAGGDPEAAIAILREQADELRSWGLKINGCADHGGGGPHRSVDLWEMDVTPQDAGLEWEAYAMQRAINCHYLSDNHGQWQTPLSVVPDRVTVILQHAEHWQIP